MNAQRPPLEKPPSCRGLVNPATRTAVSLAAAVLQRQMSTGSNPTCLFLHSAQTPKPWSIPSKAGKSPGELVPVTGPSVPRGRGTGSACALIPRGQETSLWSCLASPHPSNLQFAIQTHHLLWPETTGSEGHHF